MLREQGVKEHNINQGMRRQEKSYNLYFSRLYLRVERALPAAMMGTIIRSAKGPSLNAVRDG